MPSSALPQSTIDFAAARRHMIDSQLRPNGVRDERILTAMGELPREMFMPPALGGIAYIDEDVAIAPHRYLLEPMVLAKLLQATVIKPSDTVLDIAPASGYSTAVIAALAHEVTAVEPDPALAQQATRNLAMLGIGNASVQTVAAAEGWSGKAPYDVIVINGGIETLPDQLSQQLKEGGRLVAVMRRYGPQHAAHTGEARLYEKIRGTLSHRSLFDANVRLLPGFEAPKTFSF